MSELVFKVLAFVGICWQLLAIVGICWHIFVGAKTLNSEYQIDNLFSYIFVSSKLNRSFGFGRNTKYLFRSYTIPNGFKYRVYATLLYRSSITLWQFDRVKEQSIYWVNPDSIIQNIVTNPRNL